MGSSVDTLHWGEAQMCKAGLSLSSDPVFWAHLHDDNEMGVAAPRERAWRKGTEQLGY